MTDCGAAPACGYVPKKLQEHDGITMGASRGRKITEGHGTQMGEQREREPGPVSTPGCRQQIGERDGSRVPIVTREATAGDKRKHKTLPWQEARLAWVHAHGSVTPKGAATFGGRVEESGHALRSCAVAAGCGTNPLLHGVGAGAVWIAEQCATAFGPQASSLVDFYHVWDSLAAAAPPLCARCAPRLAGNPAAALEKY